MIFLSLVSLKLSLASPSENATSVGSFSTKDGFKSFSKY